jgi:hypothetical protein
MSVLRVVVPENGLIFCVKPRINSAGLASEHKPLLIKVFGKGQGKTFLPKKVFP